MKLPVIHGYIDRRILINFTADPQVVEKIIPFPFRPKLYKNKAIVGICLIRLKGIKALGLPDFMGFSSENGAHRIAVEWDEGGEVKSGVYIPRRDTSSRINTWVGGRIFPGKHYHARFNVKENDQNYHIDFKSSDQLETSIDARETAEFNSHSVFGTLEEASCFFQKGSLGYSPNKNKLEGLELNTYTWEMQPLEVVDLKSTFYENENLFPKGSVVFDHALLMLNIEHTWKMMPEKSLTK
ncbi:DUF2071 domain-containing protein [Chryseobacterium pennipullorum]|uniref:DUF2071 domain-containing protein n=1 Tax=Chryseobacterium pennipullorum TaxID=2258963 RepID=A0A3D9B1K4_9FLAO|nr:DUF2071 domain-containing protein [Chryseobacterium pennipullorum]REC47504.1 hypothetical protein DRF67_10710 [Chryseobacterium pennipullorum]